MILLMFFLTKRSFFTIVSLISVGETLLNAQSFVNQITNKIQSINLYLIYQGIC